MADIIRPDFRPRPPVLRAIDNFASFETPNMRWLREAGEHFRRANEEARNDPDGEAA